jgi:hypothetical protein
VYAPSNSGAAVVDPCQQWTGETSPVAHTGEASFVGLHRIELPCTALVDRKMAASGRKSEAVVAAAEGHDKHSSVVVVAVLHRQLQFLQVGRRVAILSWTQDT